MGLFNFLGITGTNYEHGWDNFGFSPKCRNPYMINWSHEHKESSLIKSAMGEIIKNKISEEAYEHYKKVKSISELDFQWIKTFNEFGGKNLFSWKILQLPIDPKLKESHQP